MNASRVLTTFAFVSAVSVSHPANSSQCYAAPVAGISDSQPDSLALRLGRELSKVTTTEAGNRKLARRDLQRKGYASVLAELLRGDGPGSILAFLRMKLQIEFFLPHNTVYVYQYLDSLYLPVPQVFRYEDGTELIFETKKVRLGIKEDWTFPVDPWRKE